MRLPLFLACFLASASALAQTLRQIDELVAKAIRRYRVPGMAVAVVKDGKVLTNGDSNVAPVLSRAIVDLGIRRKDSPSIAISASARSCRPPKGSRFPS